MLRFLQDDTPRAHGFEELLKRYRRELYRLGDGAASATRIL